jgi:hypothetical protein
MKHLQKFETFSIELNENIFQDGFNAIKSKITNWKDNIVSYFNQGLNYVKNNENDPKVQQMVDAIGNLPENERIKLQTIVNDPNGTYNKINAGANTIQEAAVSVNIEKGILKILGWGAILAPIVNLGLAIANTTFHTAGSAYNTPTSHLGGPALATIFVCVGVVVGAYINWVADQKK